MNRPLTFSDIIVVEKDMIKDLMAGNDKKSADVRCNFKHGK